MVDHFEMKKRYAVRNQSEEVHSEEQLTDQEDSEEGFGSLVLDIAKEVGLGVIKAQIPGAIVYRQLKATKKETDEGKLTEERRSLSRLYHSAKEVPGALLWDAGTTLFNIASLNALLDGQYDNPLVYVIGATSIFLRLTKTGEYETLEEGSDARIDRIISSGQEKAEYGALTINDSQSQNGGLSNVVDGALSLEKDTDVE